ncbi:hypothetical protein M0805_001801 [Coniferiporia weirii]|nr:hypothetical protein M0805_001801 [Coniferiporia weirii]
MPANNANNFSSPNNSAWALSGLSAALTSLLCDNCNIKPKYFDGTSFYPYCGKTCAQSARLSQASQTQHLCLVCKARPRYNDGKKTHQYCSKRCAAMAPTKPALPNPKGPICSVSGCQKTVYVGSSAVNGLSKFCSLKHKRLIEEACLWCKNNIKKQGQFCSRACIQGAQSASPSLLEVPEEHSTFKSVAKQFKASWRNSATTCPTVRKVYKIITSQASLDKYEAYRKLVEARGNFVASGTGFDISKARTGSFGIGIYTSSTSAKSNAYSNNVNFTSPLKAILLNKVIVGKGCKVLQANTALRAPPAGYDSVLAELGGGQDELIVYTNDAVRPSFLLTYDS